MRAETGHAPERTKEQAMDMTPLRKALLASYAYSIREVRSWDSQHSFIVSEIPEDLRDELLQETSELPVGNSRALRDVRSWWRDIGAVRCDWEAATSAQVDFMREEDISNEPTFHMITNYSHADGLAAPDFNGRLVRALCFCDEFGRFHYTDAASGTQGIGGGVRIQARHGFKDVVFTSVPRSFVDHRATRSAC
jgi:hypothetical protein